MNIKKIIKNNSFLLSLVTKVYYGPIYNLFGSKYKKKVLFSYSTFHFKKKKYLGHSNYSESLIIAEIFDSLGYQIDIVNNNEYFKGDLQQYDIIFGEGIPLYQAGIKNINKKKIYYATGSHPWQCTNASYQRLISHIKNGRDNGLISLRLQNPKWGVAANLADKVICIGNSNTKKTFLDNGVKNCNIHLINPSFHNVNANEKYSKSESARKTVLWFGSTGLLHKGLDVTVDAFNERTDWNLFICGKTEDESKFIDSLTISENIKIEGFISIDSPKFKNIINNTSYVILPSCSEGIATSVITAMGRGFMIPIVTNECGVDLDDFGFQLNDISKESIISVLSYLDNLSDEDIRVRAIKARQSAVNNYSIENYRDTMEIYLKGIINDDL